MLISVSSISGSPGVSSWSLLLSAAWPGDDQRNRVLVETDSTGGVLAVRYGLSSTPGIVELISNVRQGIGLRETLTASAHRLDEQLWAVPSPSSADAAWPILVRMGDLGPVLSGGDDIWFVDCGRWWPSSPCVGITSAADLNLIFVDAEDSSLLSVRSRVHHFRQFSKVGVVVVGSTQRSLEELEMNFGADKVWNIPNSKQLDILAGQAATTGKSKRSKARRSKAWRQALKMSIELRQLMDSDQGQQRPTAHQPVSEPPPFETYPAPNEATPQVQPVADFRPPPVPVEAVSPEAVSPVSVPPVPPRPPIEQTEIASMSMPEAPIKQHDSLSAVPDKNPVGSSISTERYNPASAVPPVMPPAYPLPGADPAVPLPEPVVPPMPDVVVVPDRPAMPPVESSVPARPVMPPIDAMTTLSSSQLSGLDFHVGEPATEERPLAPELSPNEQLPVDLNLHKNKSLQEIAATTANVPGVMRTAEPVPPEVSNEVPGMPPVHNVTDRQTSIDRGAEATLAADNVAQGYLAEPPNPNYFYDAPTLMPAKKDDVLTSDEAVRSNGGSIDGDYEGNGS